MMIFRNSIQSGMEFYCLWQKSHQDDILEGLYKLRIRESEKLKTAGASMHMISKKDLSEAEMETLTKSCSPTIVITANGEVQTHEEAIVYVKELEYIIWLWRSSITRQQ